MYKQFYGLQLNPFEITPDPSFLFPSTRHKEALASLYYGVMRRKGFSVITGEVGTGKTLIVRFLLQQIRSQNMVLSYVFNSLLTPFDFLRTVACDFGLPDTGWNKGQLLMELNNFLLSCHKDGLTAVLVIDEAHHLSQKVLEEIRLLMNLETAQEKLLQILLVGQPELDTKLDSFELRQLKQRIAIRCQLDPLNPQETLEYIQRRLRVAGCEHSAALNLFPLEAAADVHRYSGGIPRLINVVCENALLVGYARGARRITSDIFDEVARAFRLTAAASQTPQPAPERNELWQSVKTLVQMDDPSEAVARERRAPERGTNGDHYEGLGINLN
jgi:general secretion pathway protein A